MKTMQETFDFVINHLIKQGKQAYEKSGKRDSCMYLDKDGNKCAVGCLIPDGHPAQKQVNVTLHNLVCLYTKNGIHPLPEELYEYTFMLVGLQEIHDYKFNWTDFGFDGFESAKRIANEFNLEWNF